MKKFMSAAAAGVILAVAGVAQAAPPAAPNPGRPGLMKTETRADVIAQVQRMFARLDTNHDGFVTKAEADAAQAQVAQNVQKAAERFDTTKMFDRFDTNHDGKITKAEADAVIAARVAARGNTAAGGRKPNADAFFARADTNKDGVISRAEFDAVAGQMKSRMERAGLARGGFGERMFATSDLNHDGKVSLAEAQQVALQHFDRADLNHDGQVTPQERQQLRQQMQAQKKK